MTFNAKVSVRLKPGVVDAEGQNVKKALNLLGLEVDNVAFIKTYEVRLTRDTREMAQSALEEACRRLLANPVVHEYAIEVHEV